MDRNFVIVKMRNCTRTKNDIYETVLNIFIEWITCIVDLYLWRFYSLFIYLLYLEVLIIIYAVLFSEWWYLSLYCSVDDYKCRSIVIWEKTAFYCMVFYPFIYKRFRLIWLYPNPSDRQRLNNGDCLEEERKDIASVRQRCRPIKYSDLEYKCTYPSLKKIHCVSKKLHIF